MAIKLAGDRSRSPRYPSHSLPQANEFVRKVYEGIHRSPVDSLTMLRIMGFAGKSGASATALGSMRQYGLIQGFADNTRVSDLALSILEPISDEERENAIKKAAESPAVFNQILERFGGRLPNSSDALRAYLIRELGFSSTGARDCIVAITGTQDFLRSLESAASPKSVGLESQESDESGATLAPMASSPTQAAAIADALMGQQLNQINMNIQGDRVHLDATLDYNGLLTLEKKIAALKVLLTTYYEAIDTGGQDDASVQ